MWSNMAVRNFLSEPCVMMAIAWFQKALHTTPIT